jgi:hypothetical protein
MVPAALLALLKVLLDDVASIHQFVESAPMAPGLSGAYAA